MNVLHLAGELLLVAGAFFAVSGTVGLLRLPDFFTRTHAAGIADTAGAGLILLGLLLMSDTVATAVRLVLILVFMLFASPTAANALAQAALLDGVKPLLHPRGRAP